MPELPTGAVTFISTGTQGSSVRWEQLTQAMQTALDQHDALLRSAIESRGDGIVKATGDGILAAFATAPDGRAATVEAWRALYGHDWGDVGPRAVRMVLHIGVAEQRDGDDYGSTLNRTTRLMAAGHGVQIVLSAATQELVPVRG